jgi:hypothetical protein
MNTSKNYLTENGDKWVIGGELEVLPEATVTGLNGGVTPAAHQDDSTAEDATALAADFNALLAKLQAAGLMATE